MNHSGTHSKTLQSLVALAGLTLSGLTLSGLSNAAAATTCPAFLNQDLHKLRSAEILNICKAYAGKPMLIVNTASHCGFTPQFKGLQALHEKYQSRGLVVLGFPSDSFHQEAKVDTETAAVCYINYGVKFPMVATSEVKGAGANTVFKELNQQAGEPKWNFNKYLVTPDGKVVKHFDSTVAPDSKELTAAIEAVLPAK
jgi:glutathione peroxidase